MPFPKDPRSVKFLVVVVDYITKWTDAEPLACVVKGYMIMFLLKNIVTRFRIPKVLITGNGLQFSENPFRICYIERGLEQHFTLVAYPQANGQTKMSNRTLVNRIKKRIGKANDIWVEELPGVL